MDKIIFHIDVNSAFLSWSVLEKNKEFEFDIRDVPSVVGGDKNSRKGIILAKSTSAKKYGIVTGEPLTQALKKCPNLLVVPPNYSLYKKCSNNLFNLLSKYSDRLDVLSIDECFLDYTGMEKLFGNPIDTAFKIKEEIKNTLGFTVNVGIGENRLLAKMAGELEKPDKVITLFKHEIKEKLWPLAVKELYMVGTQSAAKLEKIGIFTIGQLANLDDKILEKEFKSHGLLMKNYANGIGSDYIAPFKSEHIYKSISNSITTPKDIIKKEDAHLVLLSLAQKVGERVRKHQQFTTSISVSVKTNEFKTYSHQVKLRTATNSTNIIYETSKEIFDKMWKKEPLRLIGISADKLTFTPDFQLDFLSNTNDKEIKAENAIDNINKKFGGDKVIRCALLGSKIQVGKGSTFSKDNK